MFNWKEKLLDNLISQKVLFGLLFATLTAVVQFTPDQADVFKALIYATLGSSAVKSVAGAMRSKEG